MLVEEWVNVRREELWVRVVKVNRPLHGGGSTTMVLFVPIVPASPC